MKTMFRVLLIGTAMLLVSQTAVAQQYRTIGAPDCGRWLNQPADWHKSWLLGFLSGQNAIFFALADPKRWKDRLEKLRSTDQAIIWMDNYCRANPLNSVADGGIDLGLELSKMSNRE